MQFSEFGVHIYMESLILIGVPRIKRKTLQTRQPHLQEAFLPYKEMICSTQSTSDIDNSIAKRLDTGKTVVYCHTRHLAGKLFL